MAALFLVARLAPSFHAAFGHHDDPRGCTDGLPYVHFDPDAAHPGHSDCPLCTQSIGTDALPDPAALDAADVFEPAPMTASPVAAAGAFVLLACPRGPPLPIA